MMTTPATASGISAGEFLTVTEACFRYDATTRSAAPDVLRHFTLSASAGEFVSLVGPSGCGKSTLLYLLAGLSRPTSGTISLDGKPVSSVRRDVGFVFQRDALLPWKTLRENVALSQRYRRVPKRTALDRAQEWLDRVGIPALGDRYPHQVSGGQRKRASICATMISEPRLMLMDEPFSALDAQTRDLIETDVLNVWASLGGQTVIFVTHDIEEAVALSDRVVVVSRGPGTVIAEYRIDLPRPRDVREIRATEEFRRYSECIWKDLREEVMAVNRQR